MSVYLYKYNCPRWWGYSTGVNNIYSSKENNEEEIIKKAIINSNKLTGSKSCDIYLLQQFELNIKLIKNYAGLTSIDTFVDKDNKKY